PSLHCSVMELNLGAYSVECTECDLYEDADDYLSLERFARKHVEHTGHDIRWTQGSTVPDVSVSESTDYSLRCETCGDSWSFDSRSDAEAYQADHAEYTDHEAADEIEEDVSWTAHCDSCRASQEFATQAEAEEWRDEHRTKDHRTGFIAVEGTTQEERTESPKSDSTVVETGRSKSQRDRVKSFKELISELENEFDDGAPLPLVVIEAGSIGMTQPDAQTELDNLKQKGEVYEPREGFVRTT
ncbi:MAG TPA: hypothetical protein VE134_05185, partial [Methanomicrobiales archaeon]|nr:hypothetical protein [Methanomicrobiales archaeon]